jgi:hypothetical protein
MTHCKEESTSEGGGACSKGMRKRGRLGNTLQESVNMSIMAERRTYSAGDAQGDIIPIRFGAKRKMFSWGSSSLRADRDLFLEGVRLVDLDGVALPLPVDKSSLSSAGTPKAAFCRRVRALIVDGRGDGLLIVLIGLRRMTRQGDSRRSRAQHSRWSLREIRMIRKAIEAGEANRIWARGIQ